MKKGAQQTTKAEKTMPRTLGAWGATPAYLEAFSSDTVDWVERVR